MNRTLVKTSFKSILSMSFICVLSSVSVPTQVDALQETQKTKNVIMIQTDHEMFYQHGTEYDTYKIKRPYYDEFCSTGVQFSNAKSINPLCSPARRTTLTGLYPHQHGIITNSTGLTPTTEPQTIYDVLLTNGFDNKNIYFYGKTHYSGSLQGEDTPYTTYGVQGWQSTGYGQPYKTDRYRRYLEEHNYFGTPQYTAPIMTLIDSPLNANPIYGEGDSYNIANMNIITGNVFGILDTPKEYHECYFLADMVNDQLQQIVNSGNEEGFVMSVNFWGPHHPYYPTQEFVDLYVDENGILGGDIDEHPSFRDDFSNKPMVYAYDNQSVANPSLEVPHPKSWEEFRRYLAVAYAQTTMVDDAVGQILNTIKRLGLDENTTVIWTSDHGDALSSHGGHSDKECYTVEEILDIPMAINSPDFPQEIIGKNNYAYVNNADVPVTMLGVMGYEFETYVVGMDMVKLAKGEITPREYMVCESNGHFSDTRARTIYYDNYKYTYYLGDIDELYDLTNDRYELNNLINDPMQQGRITFMRNLIREWQIQEKDFIPLVNV